MSKRRNAAPLRTVEEIISAIESLPRDQREDLGRRLAKQSKVGRQLLFGYAVLSADRFQFLLNTACHLADRAVASEDALSRAMSVVHELKDFADGLRVKSGKCHEAKKEQTRKRHELIDKLIEQGFRTDDKGDAIYKHLREQNPELLKLKKSTRNKKYIGANSMWQKYQRSKPKPR